ncbi:hypothetical protein [Neptunitalea lumnitzerae]|uniref:Transmembrane protein n=1 Tax=Neptunitalea lumnitzerae TaxID=2965509 RepID=A0ABQ5MMV5_9FLAO|nr:hypothetical protein [Neptunitalea sp. Y10]GLB50729.1 hypothetical protein Y10_30970 [Neptunitalea sp. Y10]
MQKIFNIGILALGIICFVLWYLLLQNTDPYSDVLFYVSYILLAIAVVGVAIFSIINIVSSGEKIKRTLIGLGALAVVVILGYVLADGSNIDFDALSRADINVTEAESKTVGAGLITFYILMVVALGSMLLSGIKKMFN